MSISLRLQLVTALLCLGACMQPSAAAEWTWTTPTPGTVNIAAVTGPALQETVSQEVPIASVTLVVNEVFPKGSNTDAEFVELYNYGNIDVDASGLVLMNKAGKTAVLPADTMITKKSYMTFRGLLAITDGGDTITLQRGAEEIDRLEFDSTMVRDDFSAGRYCDVYELRFCETKASVATPDAMNVLEALKVWVEPADGILRPGQKPQFFANNKEARIVISPLPSIADARKSFVYSEPLTIDDSVTYWYYAQHDGQATVPQKIIFVVNKDAPTEAQLAAAKGVMLNEVMIDATNKKGWVELYNSGNTSVPIAQLHLDTRAKADEGCTSCLSFATAPMLAPGNYTVLELPRTTVTTLLQRQTPIEFRLLWGDAQLTTMQVSLQQTSAIAWVPTAGALMVTPVKELLTWTDIPTPGAKNLVLHFREQVPQGMMTPQILARAVYAQAAYEDTLLVVRGKALPGVELSAYGNGALLATITVGQEGLWEIKLPHDKIKNVTYMFFRLKSAEGTVGMLSAPFALPAFDGKDPRQATATVNVRAKQPTLALTVKKPTSGTTATNAPLGNVPLLSAMTGVTLTAVPTGYNLETTVLATIPEEGSRGMMARLRDALTTMLLFPR